MQTDVLIIGAGLCGTLLSHALTQRGVPHLLVDDAAPGSGSRASSGILNPVMGRKRLPVPGLLHLLPAAQSAYADLEARVGMPLLHPTTLTEHFLSQDDAAQFAIRAEELPEFLHVPADAGARWEDVFDVPFGSGETGGAFLLDLPALLTGWQRHLAQSGAFLQAHFDPEAYDAAGDGIHWNGIRARYLIHCTGTRALLDPRFQGLPLQANKGEALVVRLRDSLPRDRVFKRGTTLSLVPLPGTDCWWVGASFEWRYDSLETTGEFRRRTEAALQAWLQNPFEVVDHRVGERPTALDRNPILGVHPLHERIGIFNGMGTKGVLQAPYGADRLAARLLDGVPLDPTVDVTRFRRSLSRPFINN